MMGINKASEEYMATLADNADKPELQETLGVDFDHHKNLEALLRGGIRERDQRITELEIALSGIITAAEVGCDGFGNDLATTITKAIDVLGKLE